MPPVAQPQILLLAAGQSRRMRGRDKLLEIIDGVALLRRAALICTACPCPVWVGLPPDRPARNAALHGLPLTPVIVPDAGEGIAASLREGLTQIPAHFPVMILLADLPDITTADLTQMLDVHRATPDLILRATSAAGQAGHPVLFPAWARPALQTLQGDQGARAVLKAYHDRIKMVALPENHATTDLDTPEAWADWHAERAKRP